MEELASRLESEEGLCSNEANDMPDIPMEMGNDSKEVSGHQRDPSVRFMKYAGDVPARNNTAESNKSAQNQAVGAAEIFGHSMKW